LVLNTENISAFVGFSWKIEIEMHGATMKITQNVFFYIHGSVHRNSILIRPNKMLQYAGIYLLQNHSAWFWCPSHPLSGVHKTITAASGTGHSI
jgi:hypothetical protein